MGHSVLFLSKIIRRIYNAGDEFKVLKNSTEILKMYHTIRIYHNNMLIQQIFTIIWVNKLRRVLKWMNAKLYIFFHISLSYRNKVAINYFSIFPSLLVSIRSMPDPMVFHFSQHFGKIIFFVVFFYEKKVYLCHWHDENELVSTSALNSRFKSYNH